MVGAVDGESAVAACRPPTAVAVALLDVQMPKLGGVEALAAIRRIVPRIRGLLMTAGATLTPADLAGAEGMFAKPFDLDVVVGRVLAALADAATDAVLCRPPAAPG